MMAIPILFAAIAATSLHPGESRNIVLETDLGTVLKGEVSIVQCDCNGPCERVMARRTATSGSTYFYGAQDFPPFLNGSHCSNCFCQERGDSQRVRCRNFRMKSDDLFLLSVFAYSNSVGVKIILTGPNVQACDIPLKESKLGLLKRGQRRSFNVTCYGTCRELNGKVQATSGNPELYGIKDSLPHLQSGSRCYNCDCQAIVEATVNSCHVVRPDSSSYVFSVTIYEDSENTNFVVEAPNLKDLTEISFPSKVLDLGSANAGDKRYFKATCNGECKEVYAYVSRSSGHSGLFMSKDSVPQLDVSGFGCHNCFCIAAFYRDSNLNYCHQPSLGNSNSFFVLVQAFGNNKDITFMVEAPNIKTLDEISSP